MSTISQSKTRTVADDLTRANKQKAAFLSAIKAGLKNVPHPTRLPSETPETVRHEHHPVCRIPRI